MLLFHSELRYLSEIKIWVVLSEGFRSSLFRGVQFCILIQFNRNIQKYIFNIHIVPQTLSVKMPLASVVHSFVHILIKVFNFPCMQKECICRTWISTLEILNSNSHFFFTVIYCSVFSCTESECARDRHREKKRIGSWMCEIRIAGELW